MIVVKPEKLEPVNNRIIFYTESFYGPEKRRVNSFIRSYTCLDENMFNLEFAPSALQLRLNRFYCIKFHRFFCLYRQKFKLG